jgi:hypothetical protein
LQLTKGFDKEMFELNIHRSTVLSVAVIVIGAIILVDALPNLCKEVYSYIGQQNYMKDFGQNPVAGWMIFYFVKALLGFFMLTGNRHIVNFIELKRRKNNLTVPDSDQ